MILKTDHKKALLVGTYMAGKKESCEEQLAELESLAATYGLTTVMKMAAPLREIDAGTYLGKGKIEEIRLAAQESACDVIIFDDEISPQQQRNVEKIVERAV